MPLVLISGVFDPLHSGHLIYINTAKQMGDVICIVSDAPERHPPLVPIADRVAWLKAVGCNAYVGDVATAIREHKPRWFLKGNEWKDKLPRAIEDACHETRTAIVYTETRRNSSSKLLADYERARNAEMLAKLEAFVQSQVPASKPWEPITDYSAETRRAIEAPHADILARVFAGCTVLDYGCGFGYLVDLLRERGMEAHGWDPVYRPTTVSLWEPRDLVICREVLEHLTVPQLASTVRKLVTFAYRYVYVTTRFTPASHSLAVDGTDALDPTHISLLNQDFLRALFVIAGCTRKPELEQALDWKGAGRVLVYEVPHD